MLDAGELHIEEWPPGRGQGIMVRPDDLRRYVSVLSPEMLVAGGSVALTVTGGAFAPFEHTFDWPASPSVATFTALRATDGGVEVGWHAAGEQVLSLSILGSDLNVLAMCSLDASTGRAVVERSVLEGVGAIDGRAVRATFIRDYDVAVGNSRVSVEIDDTRDFALE